MLRSLIVVIGFMLVAALGGCSGNDGPGSGTIDVWTTEKTDKDRLLLLLKPRTASAEYFTLAAPPELIEVSNKMRAAMQKDQAVTLEIMSKQDADGAVIYDPRMGVTQKEYDILKDAPNRMTLRKSGDLKISLESKGPTTVQLNGLPQLDDVTFDAATMTVTTPHGKISKPTSVEPNDRQKITGKIAGISWKNFSAKSTNPDNTALTSALVAQSQENRDVWLEFRVTNNSIGQETLHYFVRFPGPK